MDWVREVKSYETCVQDDDIYKQFKTEETNKKSYDEKAMMIEVLKRGGDSNLRLRNFLKSL